MTEPKRDKENMQTTDNHGAGHIYTYESAGIAERTGNVPVWLWAVVISLVIWGVYYLVTYWNTPLGPT